MLCVGSSFPQNCPNKEKRSPKCANCRGPQVANYKGCPAYKDQAFRQHVVQNQVSYASILKKSFTTNSQQHIQLHSRTNCIPGHKRGNTNRSATALYQEPAEKQVLAKSDLSKQIVETAKKNVQGSV